MENDNNQFMDRLRLHLAGSEARLQLAILGLFTGLFSGMIIILFRMCIESVQSSFLPGGNNENYEQLPLWALFLLPTAGGLLLGLIFQFGSHKTRQIGIVHVMERLAYHHGNLPWRNAVAQFFGAALSIISGHSVGREGPCAHLGATGGSLVGQWLQLPNNSTRTLVACGVAAAIGASFNTPLAGVIFAMEVVMMEYTLSGFMPVILAAVSGTALTRLVYGASPAFVIPQMEIHSIEELPLILLMGIMIGALASLFIKTQIFFTGFLQQWPIWQRMTLAGILTGVCALMVPQIMGIGYDTVNSALIGELGLGLMAGIVAVKIFATAAGLGLGLPGGMIGPTLVIGATAGGAFGMTGKILLPGDMSSHAFYAIIGMGAMMGATLQAPLSALMAMLELTANPGIILPGMLAVIGSGLTASEIFGKTSIFISLMRARGLEYKSDPVTQALQRIGIASIMNTNFVIWQPDISRRDLEMITKGNAIWLLLEKDHEIVALVDISRLQTLLRESGDDHFDLLKADIQRKKVGRIHLQATLHEAQDLLERDKNEALYVQRRLSNGITRTFGVILPQDIEAALRH